MATIQGDGSTAYKWQIHHREAKLQEDKVIAEQVENQGINN